MPLVRLFVRLSLPLVRLSVHGAPASLAGAAARHTDAQVRAPYSQPWWAARARHALKTSARANADSTRTRTRAHTRTHSLTRTHKHTQIRAHTLTARTHSHTHPHTGACTSRTHVHTHAQPCTVRGPVLLQLVLILCRQRRNLMVQRLLQLALQCEDVVVSFAHLHMECSPTHSGTRALTVSGTQYAIMWHAGGYMALELVLVVPRLLRTR